jgi:hypothetical protein
MAKAKKKNFGKGDFCVFTSTGKKVRCYEREQSANNVAKAFSKNPRIKLKYHVKKRGR